MTRKPSAGLILKPARAKKGGTDRQAKNQITEQRETRAARRAFIVLGAVVFAFCTIGALAAWRGISSMNVANNASGGNALTGPMPNSTPPNLPANAPSKEYIYAGSALLATSEPFRDPPDDLAIWRRNPSNASTWLVMNSQQQTISFQFGAETDIPITRDFDGDGKTDFCVYRPSNGTWYIVKSSDGAWYSVAFGAANDDKPTAADYDGDGKADIAVFRVSTGVWYVNRSSDGGLTSFAYGLGTDQPESADYDGDGKADIAVWRDSAATFYYVRSTDNGLSSCSIGMSGDKPVIGDYDGDGKADFATWRSDGYWRMRLSATNTFDYVLWGDASDIPVPGNYSDGDAKTDVAIWRPSNGSWYIKQSSGVYRAPIQFGQANDIPVPAPFKR